MTKKSLPAASIVIDAERDLRKNMRSINQLLNANPDLARLVIINPILVLEDLGIQLSTTVKHHIMNQLRFPPKLIALRDQLAKEIETDLKHLNIRQKLPLNNQQRAKLLFESLKIQPTLATEKKSLPGNKLEKYSKEHAVIAKLAKYERISKGGLIFHPRSTFEQYKSGEKKLVWINTIRFKT